MAAGRELAAHASVLGNDTDADQDPLRAVLVSDVSHGMLTLRDDGTFDYRPDADFHGEDSFQYRASDGATDSDTVSVTLLVQSINDAPIASPDAYVVPRAGSLIVAVGDGVLQNDRDIEEDRLTAIQVSSPEHGTVTLRPDGSFDYRSDASFVLSDQFSYRATDGSARSEIVTVRLTFDGPTIEVGDHPLKPNLAGQKLMIYVTGGQSVSGLDLFAQIGDGGPELVNLGLPPGTRGPVIAGVDLKTDTIFRAIPDQPIDLGSLPQVANWSVSLSGGGNVSAEGLLATITVDTTGLFEGTWNLSLTDVLPDHPFGPLTSTFANELAHISNGTINIVPTQVVGRHVFYNHSAWDGNDPNSGPMDDAAIATEKSPLMPGQTATSANYTNYSRGINGIIIDIAGLPAANTLTVDDFRFRVGRSNDLSSWQAAPTPQLSVRTAAGINGSDRLTLIWPDHAIQQEWLEVTVLASSHTALARSDVFFFGNAIGETENTARNTLVTSVDVIAIRDHQRGPFSLAPIDDVFDINRDRLVSSIDVIIARDHQVGPLTALPLISPTMRRTRGDTGSFSATWRCQRRWCIRFGRPCADFSIRRIRGFHFTQLNLVRRRLESGRGL